MSPMSVHAIDCDMGADCTCGAYGDRPTATFKERATAVIDRAFGGAHHVGKITWQIDEGADTKWPTSYCHFTVNSLGTFDDGSMSRLVFACHDQCVRAEAEPAMRYIKIFLSDRFRKHKDSPMMTAHPRLEDHIAYVRHKIDQHELAKRMGLEPMQRGPKT